MTKKLLEDFVARKKAWRRAQARLPMAEKAKIVEALRDRHLAFRKLRTERRKNAQSD
jgi:hypothetical protein